jgi:hypothetical protein
MNNNKNKNNIEISIFDQKLDNDITSLFKILNDIRKSNIKNYILYTKDIYNDIWNLYETNNISEEDRDFIIEIQTLEEDITDFIRDMFWNK